VERIPFSEAHYKFRQYSPGPCYRESGGRQAGEGEYGRGGEDLEKSDIQKRKK
jgi:hypothetical protein